MTYANYPYKSLSAITNQIMFAWCFSVNSANLFLVFFPKADGKLITLKLLAIFHIFIMNNIVLFSFLTIDSSTTNS